jgi:multisubunit Na+/H+ antiporter MnhB subunit
MRPSLVFKTATRLLVGMILVFSVYLLLRGHNAPGGGFSGALVAATGFAMYAMAEGAASVRKALRVDPSRIVVAGILLALASGIFAVFSQQPFLTGVWWTVTLLGSTEIKIGTPFFFDVGVYAIVLGAILTLILALEEELEEN